MRDVEEVRDRMWNDGAIKEIFDISQKEYEELVELSIERVADVSRHNKTLVVAVTVLEDIMGTDDYTSRELMELSLFLKVLVRKAVADATLPGAEIDEESTVALRALIDAIHSQREDLDDKRS